VSLRAWQWIAGLFALLLLVIPAGYTWAVLDKAPSDVWSWWHQFVATFFSVAFTGAIAVWLYAWQTAKATVARKLELRIAQYIGIFNIWDQLKDANLEDADLPDGSVEKVLLTFLQPTIFEESIRSGLFGASETALLSRLAGAIHVYNDSVVGFVTHAKSFTSEDKEHMDSKRVEALRNTIHMIQANRETVVEVSKSLLSRWSIEELSAANAAADSSQEPDPGIAQLIAEIQEENFRISPEGYKDALYTRLDKSKEAAAEDTESACASLDEIIKEAQDLSDKEITPEEANQLISATKAAKKELGCS
jgi:hypothetical protein